MSEYKPSATWLEHNPPENDFSDLDSDLDAVEVTNTPKDQTFLDAQVKYAPAAAHYERASSVPAVYPCERCSGAGMRFGGTCYRCGGSGKQKRKPVDRSPQAVEKRAQVKARKEERKSLERAAYIKEHAHVFDWLNAARTRNNLFAANLLSGFNQYGQLTERQVTAVENALVEDERRAQESKAYEEARIAAQAAAATNPAPTPVGLSLTHIPAGRYAVPNGDTRLKVLIQKPVAPSKWVGWVFASDAAEYGQRQKYGSQKPGANYQGKIIEELKIIAADPKAAAIAYGQLTGTCCICGAKLENAESIAAGIGPVCAGKF